MRTCILFGFIGIMDNYVKKATDIFGLAKARGDVEPLAEPPVPAQAPAAEPAPGVDVEMPDSVP